MRCGDWTMLARVGKQRQISRSERQWSTRATVERDDRAIVWAAVAVPDSSLSAIHRVDENMSNMTFETWLRGEFMFSTTVVTLTSHACTLLSPIRVVPWQINDLLRWLATYGLSWWVPFSTVRQMQTFLKTSWAVCVCGETVLTIASYTDSQNKALRFGVSSLLIAGLIW